VGPAHRCIGFHVRCRMVENRKASFDAKFANPWREP
jgi:hypothetical protein